jgi:Zn-finger nucleic acid-binding protein
MKCPSCQTTLQIAERQGVEIDYCPQCRGVWLDRGELDKIIDRMPPEPASGYVGAVESREAPRRFERDDDYERRDYRHDHERHDDRRYSDRDYDYRRRKRKNFLSELFDFD